MNNREKSEKFLEELGNIDDKLLEEAMNYKKKKISIKKIVAAAACVALMIGTIPLISHFAGTPAGTGTTGDVVQGTTGDNIIQAGTTGNNIVPSGTTQNPITPPAGNIITPTGNMIPPTGELIQLGKNGIFTAYDTGIHAGDSALNAVHTTEFKPNQHTTHFVDETKVKTIKTFNINGKTWYAQYNQSIDNIYYGRDRDLYVGIDLLTWRNMFIFEYDRDTGELIGFSAEQKCLSPLPETPITRDECYEKAMEFLTNNVPDIEEYALYNESEATDRKGFKFSFCRMIDGIKTDDNINIGVTGAGEIYDYHFWGYGAMGNVKLSEVDKTALNKVIDTKINTIYKNSFDITSNYEIRLCRLEDGTYYFYCTTHVTGRATKDGELLQDTSFLIVTID